LRAGASTGGALFLSGAAGGVASYGTESLMTGRPITAGGVVFNGLLGGGLGYGLGKVFAALGGKLPVTRSSVPTTLEGLQSRIATYGQRAIARAWEKGLYGAEAGFYADRYLSKAVSQLNRGLERSGSQYRAYSQYGRNARGNEFWGMNRPLGTRFLDAVITNPQRTIVYSGWDISFHSQARPVWNSLADNQDYLRLFGIREGFVREIGIASSRP